MRRCIIIAIFAVVAAVGALGEDSPWFSEKWKTAAARSGKDWKPVAWASEDRDPFLLWSVNSTRYTRQGDEFSGWVRQDAVPDDTMADGSSYTFHVVRFFARCSKMTYRFGTRTYYDASGEVVGSDEARAENDWEEAAPETIAEALINYMCSATPTP